jgi:hypothetical protein
MTEEEPHRWQTGGSEEEGEEVEDERERPASLIEASLLTIQTE